MWSWHGSVGCPMMSWGGVLSWHGGQVSIGTITGASAAGVGRWAGMVGSFGAGLGWGRRDAAIS